MRARLNVANCLRTVRVVDAVPVAASVSVTMSVSVHVSEYSTPVIGMSAPPSPVVQSTVLPVAVVL